jgi:hypothetical protein
MGSPRIAGDKACAVTDRGFINVDIQMRTNVGRVRIFV